MLCKAITPTSNAMKSRDFSVCFSVLSIRRQDFCTVCCRKLNAVDDCNRCCLSVMVGDAVAALFELCAHV